MRWSSMIAGFSCKETEKIWNQEYSRKLPLQIQETALTKLRILNAAVRLENLRVPPGNRLEALKGDRKRQHSIRITGNGGSALSGVMAMRTKSKLSITIKS
jgi:proteic killer suppression protein